MDISLDSVKNKSSTPGSGNQSQPQGY
jgi:hypothetical protein